MSQAGPPARRLPPVSQLAVCSIAMVVISGVYLAAYLPHTAPLPLPIVLVCAAGLLLFVNIALLSRLQGFAWRRFFQVGGWVLAAYLVISGMLEYVFLLDHSRGPLLVLLTASLALFALDIPVLMAFSVARHQPTDGLAAG